MGHPEKTRALNRTTVAAYDKRLAPCAPSTRFRAASPSFQFPHAHDKIPKLSAPVAQLDRAFGYEPKGREFDSLRAHHSNLCPCFHLGDLIAIHFYNFLWPNVAQLKPQTARLGAFLPKHYVVPQLPCIRIRYRQPRMPQP
jgi:hypothetical protein